MARAVPRALSGRSRLTESAEGAAVFLLALSSPACVAQVSRRVKSRLSSSSSLYPGCPCSVPVAQRAARAGSGIKEAGGGHQCVLTECNVALSSQGTGSRKKPFKAIFSKPFLEPKGSSVHEVEYRGYSVWCYSNT